MQIYGLQTSNLEEILDPSLAQIGITFGKWKHDRDAALAQLRQEARKKRIEYNSFRLDQERYKHVKLIKEILAMPNNGLFY